MIKRIFLAIIMISCLVMSNCTMPEMVEAKFEKETEEIINELKLLKNFEDAGIRWHVTTSGEKNFHSLQVQLLNGEDLSEDEEILKKIGKEALKIVFNSIENEEEYDGFNVMFIQKKSIGIVSSSFNKGFGYKYEEIIDDSL